MLESYFRTFDAAALAVETVPPSEVAVPAEGGFPAKMAMLQNEFAGQSQLAFYHAALVVMIRRKIDIEPSVERFRDLWRDATGDLCAVLSSRWLVSACDTFMDYGRGPERALGMAGALFANTVKLYETERLATTGRESVPTYKAIAPASPLYDGLTSFMIGEGDMVKNLMQRTANTISCYPTFPVAQIVATLVARARANDTVYQRFGAAHTKDATQF